MINVVACARQPPAEIRGAGLRGWEQPLELSVGPQRVGFGPGGTVGPGRGRSAGVQVVWTGPLCGAGGIRGPACSRRGPRVTPRATADSRRWA
jgi:hypothetical protein